MEQFFLVFMIVSSPFSVLSVALTPTLTFLSVLIFVLEILKFLFTIGLD